MAFRITYQGAVVETDSAIEVQQLLLAFREPLPARPLLPAAVVVDAPPARARTRRGPMKAARREGGGAPSRG